MQYNVYYRAFVLIMEYSLLMFDCLLVCVSGSEKSREVTAVKKYFIYSGYRTVIDHFPRDIFAKSNLENIEIIDSNFGRGILMSDDQRKLFSNNT